MLKNRVALITGAGGGIGREISVSLAKEGVNLILFGGNNLEKLEKTADIVKEYGVQNIKDLINNLWVEIEIIDIDKTETIDIK